MKNSPPFDVIIIGGSFAGLSAAMALGRSLRRVLIIDGGQPCNRQTPHSHNFITHDGETPQSIAEKARRQVLQYDSVQYYNGLAVSVQRAGNSFEVNTDMGQLFLSKKLLFATGLTDVPNITGAADCWGISVLHCPYCHGYEVRHKNLGVVGNGDIGFEFAKLIHNWSNRLTVFTNGTSTLTSEQTRLLQHHGIAIVEHPIEALDHKGGNVNAILFRDGTSVRVDAIFARFPFKQHSNLPEQLGCEITDHGYIRVDELQRTTIPGIYAAGDNSSPLRAVAAATAAGNKAAAAINKDLIDEEFLIPVGEDVGVESHD